MTVHSDIAEVSGDPLRGFWGLRVLRVIRTRAWISSLPAASLVAIGVGVVFQLSGAAAIAHWTWMGGLITTGSFVVWRTLREALRGHFATDVVATLSILTAVVLQVPVPGLIVVLMQTGGEALERYAARRASDAIRQLEEAAPRIAHRLTKDEIVDVPVDAVAVGERLLVRPGELVPCDSTVEDGRAHVDTSTLTGEPVPILAEAGVKLQSGVAVLDAPLTIRATAKAGESQYARIVELVRAAQESKSPLQRLADKYAIWFTPLTIGVCVVAWMMTGDAMRVLAVLVIATPCPLILATPVAIVGGISRAARRQIIVRHGGALEQLAKVDAMILDKTGTLTEGRPAVRRILAAPAFTEDDVLRYAGAVEVGSGHLLARSVVEAATRKLGKLPEARRHLESPGRGLTGEVDGHEVIVGSPAFVTERCGAAAHSVIDSLDGTGPGLRAYVAVDGRVAGAVEFADRLRAGANGLVDKVRPFGIERVVLLSGDHAPNVRQVAHDAGIHEAVGELLPEGKVSTIRQLSHAGYHTLMVGDGTNDAPALSTADVGIALAGHGGGITAAAADIVVLVDELDRVPEALAIAHRTLRIAKQSIMVGLGLSAIGMGFAAAGMIPPIVGALGQEVIDVAVILNALRASRA